MGKAFSHTDKRVRDKAVAVFSKWISRQANLSEEVFTSPADIASLRLILEIADVHLLILSVLAGAPTAVESAFLLPLDVR